MTIKEIAKELNLSATTVSNVIRGKTKEVSPATVERVKKYLESVNFTPNFNARNLAQKKSKIIGFVMMQQDYRHINIYTDAFVSELIGSVQNAISEAGYFMMLYISPDIDEIIQSVASWNVDGLIVFATEDDDARKLTDAYHKPVVFIDTNIKENTELNLNGWYVNVGLNDEEASYTTVRYLIDQGHTRIGYISRNFLGGDVARYRGYRRALLEAGIPVPEDGLLRRYSEQGKLEYSELAEQASKFTAIVAHSDTTAILLMNALFEMGLCVPDDVSIIGFDDSASCELARPALTTVKQDIVLKGRTAVEEMLEMLNGTMPVRHHIVLGTKLIERKSVKRLK